MEKSDGWIIKFNKEIEKGYKARERGNAGMERVCARRAAGIVVKEYYRRQAKILSKYNTNFLIGASALNNIKLFTEDNEVEEEVRKVAGTFLLQLQKDHTIVGNPDFLENAEYLARNVLS